MVEAENTTVATRMLGAMGPYDPSNAVVFLRRTNGGFFSGQLRQ